jgi:hypothetical protein
VFPSAQKAFEMGEESVKLGVTCGHTVCSSCSVVVVV